MKNTQLIGFLLVLIGSFLPLIKIPIVGKWNYWELDQNLAIICWIFCGFALLGILLNKNILVKFSAIVLILLFVFTLLAVKFQSLDYFSFLPFKSWQKTFANTIKLSWGWFLEFSGAVLMLMAKEK